MGFSELVKETTKNVLLMKEVESLLKKSVEIKATIDASSNFPELIVYSNGENEELYEISLIKIREKEEGILETTIKGYIENNYNETKYFELELDFKDTEEVSDFLIYMSKDIRKKLSKKEFENQESDEYVLELCKKFKEGWKLATDLNISDTEKIEKIENDLNQVALEYEKYEISNKNNIELKIETKRYFAIIVIVGGDVVVKYEEKDTSEKEVILNVLKTRKELEQVAEQISQTLFLLEEYREKN